MKQYLKWSLIFCLVSISLASFAQDITVSAKLDTATIALGDQTVLRLKVDMPANEKVNFPSLSDTLSAKVQVVEIGKLDTLKNQKDPARWELSRAYTITSFEAGMQTVPAMVFNTANGDLKTDPLPLQVQPVAVDTTKTIYDIKQPLAVSYGFIDWLRDHIVWVLVAFMAIVLLIGLWYYLRKRKKKVLEVEELKPLAPPHEVALAKLQQLQDKKLWQQDQVKVYHSELTEIIREFLERRYGISAMEQTSDEIFESLRHKEITEHNKKQLRQVLTLADLVKFAKEKPLATDNEASMDSAVSFVKDAAEINQSPQAKVREKDEHI